MTVLRRTGRLGRLVPLGRSLREAGCARLPAPAYHGDAATTKPWRRAIHVTAPSSPPAPAPTPKPGPGTRLQYTLADITRGQKVSTGLYPTLDDFPRRHIGPDPQSTQQMLQALTPPVRDMDEFVRQVIPPGILSEPRLFPGRRTAWDSAMQGAVREAHTEGEIIEMGKALAQLNGVKDRPIICKSFIGTGYYGTLVPGVIQRNVLESPAWYTSYTPYQPEISQGRLESLLNFQTLVTDLTGLPVANASLLDEGTAAAEAMTMSLASLPSSRAKRKGRTFVVSDRVHPQTLSVLMSRAEGFGVRVDVQDLCRGDMSAVEALGDDLVGVLIQYPDTYGQIHDFRALSDLVRSKGALLSAATDLLALTLLTPPGEWGADIAFGSAQRLGVPLGFGGPHAAFFAVRDKLKRKMPGRLIGVSKDRRGTKALRLSLQTREQHIRREKATSNVCTAQALLANMSALYAVYHGPEGLKAIAERCNAGARFVQHAAQHWGFETMGSGPVPFDTVVVSCPGQAEEIFHRAMSNFCNIRLIDQDRVGISIDESTNDLDLMRLAIVFNMCSRDANQDAQGALTLLHAFLEDEAAAKGGWSVPELFQRKSSYLSHAVFNTHHSETELLRYIHHLQSKDLSLVHSMIPLGSCTMKLNATTEMALITEPGFANVHPHAPTEQTMGYQLLAGSLESQLASITGMDGVSLQPNSGAQGEFAGLRVIRKHHKSRGDFERDVCIIPVSAHGTNPASAAMAGMRVVTVKCDSKTGNLDVADLETKCAQNKGQIAAIMVTYPSTYGVFEPQIKKVCDIVHAAGGQVYMDGANMNAQIGLCSPGDIGADVCHLNLHKTFCIPHGGGGPGVGPICVKEHLIPYLPTTEVLDTANRNHPVSSAPYGSASILPISWAYNALMGAEGLKRATQVTLLNANYLLSRLRPHYPILYTNEHGRCAHEFILDARPFAATAGIEAIDIAKRLQDYGFHAPTMSWPVPNTLMIEPTESESKEEMDRFVDALVAIRAEIREVEEGAQPRKGNVLKMAPHPMADMIDGDGDAGARWDRAYSREKAAYPLPWLREKKFWPSVARLDDAYGDLNLFCTCPPVEDTV